jgi:hypothetical protein
MSLPSPSPLQASKWLKLQLLIDADEMQALCQSLAPFEIYQAGTVTPQGEGKISLDIFLDRYRHYVSLLKKGDCPNPQEFHPYFSTLWTVTPEALFALPLEKDKQLLRVTKPVIQLQPHSLDYSPYDHKFHPMVFGLDSVTWGIQYSYPQLALDPVTKEAISVAQNELFPNTLLFRALQRWVRNHTIPTPFEVEGRVINVPIRLGKQCLSWINQHPQLILRKLKVKNGD